jgi:hypothetical protein
MKTLRRVVLEQDAKPFLRGDAEEQAKRAEILKRTKKVKDERNKRAARTGGSGTTRPGYSSNTVADSIVPLTADRVNEMKRMPGTGPHTPASNRSGALKTIMQDKMSGERPQTPKRKPFTPGNVKRRNGSSVTTGPDGDKTKWGT